MQFNVSIPSICNIVKERKKNYILGIVPSRLLNLHQIANSENYKIFFFFCWKISASNWEQIFADCTESANYPISIPIWVIWHHNGQQSTVWALNNSKKTLFHFILSMNWCHLLGVSVNNLKVVYNTIFSGWPSLHISEQPIIHHKQLITHDPDGFKFIRMLQKQCV